jgi:hypothetical protein
MGLAADALLLGGAAGGVAAGGRCCWRRSGGRAFSFAESPWVRTERYSLPSDRVRGRSSGYRAPELNSKSVYGLLLWYQDLSFIHVLSA